MKKSIYMSNIKTIKRIFILLIVTAMLFSIFSILSTITVSAEATIQNGTKHNDVAKLQKQLNEVLGCNLSIDSIAGPKTVEQIRVFQKLYGLVVDGVAGEKTWAALNKAYADKIASKSNTGTMRTYNRNNPNQHLIMSNGQESPYFTVSEIMCRCGSSKCPSTFQVDTKLVDVLHRLRVKYGPVTITGAFRCSNHPNYRTNNGGISNHAYGKAVDITIKGVTRGTIIDFALQNGAGADTGYHGRSDPYNYTHVAVK